MIKLTKNQLIILVVIGGLIVLAIGYYIYKTTEENSYQQIEEISEEINTQTETNVENEVEIVVHIAGQIKNPGIIKIAEGARIADIIEQAGGLTQEADITDINLAYIVEDGQKIIIPSIEEQKNKEKELGEKETEIIQQSTESLDTKSSTTMININKANSEELQQLQGIGESTANKIIEYRKEHGEFKQIEDIKNVSGIGENKYEKIKNNIKVK